MIKTPLSVVRTIAFCLPLTLVASCGKGSEAVQRTNILINPSAIGVPVTEAAGTAIVKQLYTVELQAPGQYNQVGTEITIDSPGTVFEVNKSTNPYTFTARATPYTTTISGNGVYTVALDYFVPAAFSGSITVLEAFSGTAFGRSNVDVTCSDTNPAVNPPQCP